MFTGLVETTGTLVKRDHRGPGFRLEIATGIGPLVLGESIAVNGACLTVVEVLATGFATDVSVETVDKTTLGDAGVGSRLNLERSVRVGDRLGGHLVSGHVDGVAEVVETNRAGEAYRIVVKPPAELMGYLAPKGSVTLDGVSLTVNATTAGEIELMLIPHTMALTNLGGIAPGRRLNIEVDLLSRYVVHHLRAVASQASGTSDERLLEALARAGFIPGVNGS